MQRCGRSKTQWARAEPKMLRFTINVLVSCPSTLTWWLNVFMLKVMY